MHFPDGNRVVDTVNEIARRCKSDDISLRHVTAIKWILIAIYFTKYLDKRLDATTCIDRR